MTWMRVFSRIAVLTAALTLGNFVEADEHKVHVRMTTVLGPIELEINAKAAPITAGNFLRLVDGQHLDGGSFYRTVSPDNDNGSPHISVIQGGMGDAERPFAPIGHESTDDTGLKHFNGAISMARGPVGSAATEFFICIGDQPALDAGGKRNSDGRGFAAFGRVITGMDVVEAIHRQPSDAPTESAYVVGQILEAPVVIESVRRVAWPDGQTGVTLNTDP